MAKKAIVGVTQEALNLEIGDATLGQGHKKRCNGD